MESSDNMWPWHSEVLWLNIEWEDPLSRLHTRWPLKQLSPYFHVWPFNDFLKQVQLRTGIKVVYGANSATLFFVVVVITCSLEGVSQKVLPFLFPVSLEYGWWGDQVLTNQIMLCLVFQYWNKCQQDLSVVLSIWWKIKQNCLGKPLLPLASFQQVWW